MEQRRNNEGTIKEQPGKTREQRWNIEGATQKHRRKNKGTVKEQGIMEEQQRKRTTKE